MFNTYTSMYPFPFIFQSANCDFLHEPLAISCTFQHGVFTMLGAGMGCSGGWYLVSFGASSMIGATSTATMLPLLVAESVQPKQWARHGSDPPMSMLENKNFLTPPAKKTLLFKKIIRFPSKIAIGKYVPPFSWADLSYHLPHSRGSLSHSLSHQTSLAEAHLKVVQRGAVVEVVFLGHSLACPIGSMYGIYANIWGILMVYWW